MRLWWQSLGLDGYKYSHLKNSISCGLKFSTEFFGILFFPIIWLYFDLFISFVFFFVLKNKCLLFIYFIAGTTVFITWLRCMSVSKRMQILSTRRLFCTLWKLDHQIRQHYCAISLVQIFMNWPPHKGWMPQNTKIWLQKKEEKSIGKSIAIFVCMCMCMCMWNKKNRSLSLCSWIESALSYLI